jgi:L-lactate dehydrogenase
MSDPTNKVIIIGAGHVGSHCAYAMAMAGVVQEIVFIDINEQKAKAQADDVTDACIYMLHPVIVRAGSYEDCKDASIIVLAAGVPRKPGQTRLDTLADSIQVMKQIVPLINESGFDGILLCVSNPADVVTTYMLKHIHLPAHRIFSTGTSLDTARLKRILWKALKVHPASIECFVMGEHGDSSMIPFSHVQVGGMPLDTYLKQFSDTTDALDLAFVLERTRTVGMDIINGKDSTEFGIGSVVADLVKTIVNDQRRIHPLSTLLDGQYGQRGIAMGVPCLLGKNGIESVMELDLTPEELAQFEASCNVVRTHVAMVENESN